MFVIGFEKVAGAVGNAINSAGKAAGKSLGQVQTVRDQMAKSIRGIRSGTGGSRGFAFAGDSKIGVRAAAKVGRSGSPSYVQTEVR